MSVHSGGDGLRPIVRPMPRNRRKVRPAPEVLEDRRLLSAGDFDPTFGTGGKFTATFGHGGDAAEAMVVQPDGKIVLAGYTEISGGNFDFAAMRISPDGTLDTSFGTGGKQTVAFDLGGQDN